MSNFEDLDDPCARLAAINLVRGEELQLDDEQAEALACTGVGKIDAYSRQVMKQLLQAHSSPKQKKKLDPASIVRTLHFMRIHPQSVVDAVKMHLQSDEN